VSLFLDYKKAPLQVKRPALFSVLRKRNIPDPSLSSLVKVNGHNEAEIGLNNKVTASVEINKGVRQGCRLPPSPSITQHTQK
jgi:hypothetical protein